MHQGKIMLYLKTSRPLDLVVRPTSLTSELLCNALQTLFNRYLKRQGAHLPSFP